VVEASEILVHQQDEKAVAQHNYLKPEVNEEGPHGSHFIREHSQNDSNFEKVV
jgi:hypothetical protein